MCNELNQSEYGLRCDFWTAAKCMSSVDELKDYEMFVDL